MSKRKSGKKPQVVDQSFVKALAHDLRVQILGILTERMASPNELAKMLHEGLSQVSYHVKVLKDYGLITLTKTEPRRGAVEHYYRAKASTLLPADQWRKVDGALRTAVGGRLASELFDGLAEAIEGNKLTDADTHISRTLLFLDPEGWENVRTDLERFVKSVEKEQRKSAARQAKANGDRGSIRTYTVGVIAHENARDLSKTKPKRAKRSKAASANGKKATARGKGASKSRSSKRKAKSVEK